MGTALMVQALRLLLLKNLYGGAFTLEHPRGPERDEAQWAIWYSGFVAELLRLPQVEIVSFLQGPLGRSFPKPTRLLVARLGALRGKLYGAYQKSWKATTNLGGKEGNVWKTSAAKVYPVATSKVIAEQFITFAQNQTYGEEEPIPAAASEAITALTGKWDPYVTGAMDRMQADYNPHKKQQ